MVCDLVSKTVWLILFGRRGITAFGFATAAYHQTVHKPGQIATEMIIIIVRRHRALMHVQIAVNFNLNGMNTILWSAIMFSDKSARIRFVDSDLISQGA